MSERVYVMQYPDGKWVQRDDSTGPMSTGGYPFPVDDLLRATQWKVKEEALRYRGVTKEDWKVFFIDLVPVEDTVTPYEVAKASGDKEYEEYLRLARKFGTMSETCPFVIGWVGQCKKGVEAGEIYCEKHREEKCFSCKGQATRDCSHAGQFVCGMPMCDRHTHKH